MCVAPCVGSLVWATCGHDRVKVKGPHSSGWMYSTNVCLSLDLFPRHKNLTPVKTAVLNTLKGFEIPLLGELSLLTYMPWDITRTCANVEVFPSAKYRRDIGVKPSFAGTI